MYKLIDDGNARNMQILWWISKNGEKKIKMREDKDFVNELSLCSNIGILSFFHPFHYGTDFFLSFHQLSTQIQFSIYFDANRRICQMILWIGIFVVQQMFYADVFQTQEFFERIFFLLTILYSVVEQNHSL